MKNTTTTTNGIGSTGSDMGGLIAIDSALNGTAGRITLWRLDGDMSIAKLQDAWVAEGLDPAMLCETETPIAALKHAVRENVSSGMRNLLRPLADRKGWAYVKETATADSVSHAAPTLIAKVNAAGQPVITCTDERLVNAITATYYAHLDTISTGKAGSWFSWLMKKIDAVSLKDTGGAYYVPPQHVATWESMRRAIHAGTAHRIQRIPAMRCEETIEAVLDAITQEAERAVVKMQAQIASGELGAKALEGTRYGSAAVEALESKLARYEGIVGKRLDGLREKLDDVRATVAAALLATADDMKS